MASSTMTPMTMKRRLDGCGGAGSPAGVTIFGSGSPAFGWSLFSSATLLSSEIVFPMRFRRASGAGQRELGGVVLIDRGDVLLVGLFKLRLRLADGQVVGHARLEALLR